jgi:hypothetical protein
MVFILLSIASFVLRTSSIFQIVNYDFITVYIGANLSEHILVHNTEQRKIIASFDIIEWICKFNIYNNYIRFSIFFCR